MQALLVAGPLYQFLDISFVECLRQPAQIDATLAAILKSTALDRILHGLAAGGRLGDFLDDWPGIAGSP